MSVGQDQIAAQMAARVRARRAERRWTLDELAARSGVSRRLIVQIEQAAANPSLTTLLKLAAALGVTLAELLASQPQEHLFARVPAKDTMMLWTTSAGSAARLLISHGPLELWNWTLQPGDRHAGHPHRPGALELLTVHTGTLTLEVNGHPAKVPAGDSAWLHATHPHAYDNPTNTPVGFTLVVLDPT